MAIPQKLSEVLSGSRPHPFSRISDSSFESLFSDLYSGLKLQLSYLSIRKFPFTNFTTSTFSLFQLSSSRDTATTPLSPMSVLKG